MKRRAVVGLARAGLKQNQTRKYFQSIDQELDENMRQEISIWRKILRRVIDVSVTYLSPKIQNEIIQVLGNSVKQAILKRIKEAPFFSVIVDTTQDIVKVDQLSIIIGYVITDYVENTPAQIKIHESFLGFIPITDQTAQVTFSQAVGF